MIDLSGAVFEEWYWGPFFFALFVGPFILIGSWIVSFFALKIMRRRGMTPGRRHRIGIFSVTTVLLTLGGIAALQITEWVRFEQRVAESARSINWQVYEPSAVPDGYEIIEFAPAGIPAVYLAASYKGEEGRNFFVLQQQVKEADLEAPQCSIRFLEGASSNYFDGPCTMQRTERGREVFFASVDTQELYRSVFTLLDETLVHLRHQGLAEEEVLTYVDSLEARDPEDIDYFDKEF